ncbi:MAG: alanine--glyoxylate aminotransferase family protein, partial [Actinomycetota bacterium]|nr:alanine--glyoxylate aminotransferase family protein [Actinomycetota bacterium]
MIKKYIMTPGPTAISEEVLLEHARPLMHHRSPEFSKIFIEVTEKLKKLFKTQNDLFILTSSGTGAMEASVVNFFSTGDKVLVASIGNFGERFKKICTRYGLNVIALDYEWGDAANPDDIKNALDDNPDIKGVLLQFSETSTGALNDIETIGNIVKKYPAILIVDAISGLGASNLETDNWGLDVVIGGSQKALSAPTGVAFISVSEKAWKLNENANLPRFYFDLGTARSYAQKTPPQTPWTPGISIIVAMNKALDMMFDEGLEKVFERHRVLSLAVQRAIEKIGLKPLVKDKNKRGFSVTSIEVPEGIEAKEITKIMRVKYGVTI